MKNVFTVNNYSPQSHTFIAFNISFLHTFEQEVPNQLRLECEQRITCIRKRLWKLLINLSSCFSCCCRCEGRIFTAGATWVETHCRLSDGSCGERSANGTETWQSYEVQTDRHVLHTVPTETSITTLCSYTDTHPNPVEVSSKSLQFLCVQPKEEGICYKQWCNFTKYIYSNCT